jgi:hypothetical protein
MPLRLAAIVEGDGEVEAVPILIRRVAAEIDPSLAVRVDPVLRVPASRLMKPQELERYVEFAARKLSGQGGILILVDCDWDQGCPAQEAPALLARARQARGDMTISVVLAKKEYEAWFIAAAESLRGKRGLATDLTAPANPEDIRGAKEWLSRHMPRNRPYAETTDQPALSAVFDMAQAREADSFDKCYREIAATLQALRVHPLG